MGSTPGGLENAYVEGPGAPGPGVHGGAPLDALVRDSKVSSYVQDATPPYACRMVNL